MLFTFTRVRMHDFGINYSDAPRISKVGLSGPIFLEKGNHITRYRSDDICQLPHV